MNKYEATQKITDYEFWENKPTMEDIQECIDAGADLTKLVRTKYDYTYPLAYFVAQYLPDAIPVMVRAGMDINQSCQEGSAVELASYCMSVKPLGMKRLLENGADIHVKTANAGLGCPNPEGQAILDKIQAAGGFTLPSYTGVTCVGWALIEGVNMRDDPDDKEAEEQRQKVAMLFDAGIHPDAPAKDGEPPIFSTSFNGYEKATQMILDHGGNINAKSAKGDTALTRVGKAIARDFQANWVKEGNVPMNEAEKNECLARDYLRRLNLLISKGASLNLPDGEGKSFETGPAAQIPFVAELIRVYHEGGKEGVNQWVHQWQKIWAKEAHDRWFAAYQKNKIREAKRRSDLADDIRKELRKGSGEGRKKAIELAQKFHVFQLDDSHEEWRIKSHLGLRPTALNFEKERT